MMALAGMQAYSVAAQRNAAHRAVASAMANELAEIVRLNPTAMNAGQYNIAFMSSLTAGAAGAPNAAPCDGTDDSTPAAFPTCTTPALLAAFDIVDFQRRVRSSLPTGGVEVVANIVATPARSTADIWITWQEPGVLENTRVVGGATVSGEQNSDNCSVNAKALATLPRCFYMRVQL
jgi:type IV pilus assembly protein PilV